MWLLNLKPFKTVIAFYQEIIDVLFIRKFEFLFHIYKVLISYTIFNTFSRFLFFQFLSKQLIRMHKRLKFFTPTSTKRAQVHTPEHKFCASA